MSHFHAIPDIAKRSGALGRADARIKLIAALALIALVLLSRGIAFPALVFVISVGASLLVGASPITILLRFAEPLFIVLMLCVLKCFFSGHAETFTIFGLAGHADGLREGLLIGSRVMGAVSVMALIGFTTTFTEVIAALGWFRVPRDFIEILTFAYKYIFVLFEEAWVIYSAQKNRLGYVGLRTGIRSFGTLSGALVLKVFDHANQTSAALRQRGYEGVMPLYEGRRMRRAEAAFAAMLLVASGVLWKILARIELRDAGYRYQEGSFGLQGVTLAVQRGEFSGILGSNGSGKTTLLNLMDGMLKGYVGSVMLDGAEIGRLTPREIYSRVGLVFQNPDSQLFGGTVEEDVAFGPLNMGIPSAEIKERIRYALDATDMAGQERSRIAHLSFGQKKRICIAGLLAMGHEILLLDEPTAGLDPMGEYRMMNLLMELNKHKGVTVVMASHSVDLVPLFLNKLYILSKGRVTRSGTPEEVFNAPEEMRGVKLRLPHVAELIWQLREEDGVKFSKKLPLTVGEARRMLLRRLDGSS